VYPDDPCLTELRTMMTDAWETAPEIDEGPTWHGWGTVSGTRHIDYIFYSGFQKCTSLVRLTKSYDNMPFVSDHYPVIAVLE
jgi:endonuclease/exonuclease/phosphatase family metal-dependent hydrolase